MEHEIGYGVTNSPQTVPVLRQTKLFGSIQCSIRSFIVILFFHFRLFQRSEFFPFLLPHTPLMHFLTLSEPSHSRPNHCMWCNNCSVFYNIHIYFLWHLCFTSLLLTYSINTSTNGIERLKILWIKNVIILVHISMKYNLYFNVIMTPLLHNGAILMSNDCLYNSAVPDDEHVRPGTHRLLFILKHQWNSYEVWICWFIL